MEAMSMATLLTTIGSVVTEAVTWTGAVATMVIGNPLMLIGCVLSFIGIGIHWFKMLTA